MKRTAMTSLVGLCVCTSVATASITCNGGSYVLFGNPSYDFTNYFNASGESMNLSDFNAFDVIDNWGECS